MDPLSEIIRSTRLSGALFVDAQLTAPWSVLAQIREEECRLVVDTPVQMIAYHFVVEGRLLAAVEGEQPPIEVEALLFEYTAPTVAFAAVTVKVRIEESRPNFSRALPATAEPFGVTYTPMPNIDIGVATAE